ncbi:MAG: DNA cytosine methyltransferase [Acholeplasma sp.]|nr:DNA cytosine methyltransferase [Acholeplasma sp.]
MNTFQDNLFRELIVDNFAGGGGASTGIELALGQPVDIAINHDEMAIKMHSFNHPHTLHLQNDVFAIDPVEVTGGRPVGLAWFSPDCTHFSKAKGGKPRKKEIRDLAWVVIKWAKAVKPRIIMLENVEEFKTWGPLDDDGYPIKDKSGETFNEWLTQLRNLGYEVETKELIAANYGAPTIRKRLFIVARSDGKQIVWPTPTHSKDGKHGLKKWRGAYEVIDFNNLGTSIFERKKPLAENTLRRIARGIDKFVLNNPDPFVISYHSETQPGEVRGHSLKEPLPTQGTANRYGLVTPSIKPFVMVNNTGHGGKSTDEPLPTITTGIHDFLTTPVISKIGQTGFSEDRSSDIREPLKTVVSKNEDILINPVIVPVGYGEAPNQAPRVQDIKQPLNTVVSHSTKHNVVSYIGKEFSGNQVHASDLNKPLPTVTSIDHNRLVSVFVAKYYSDNNGQVQGSKATDPLSTITTEERNALVSVHLMEYYSNSKDSFNPNKPLHTVTSKDKHAMVSVKMEQKIDLKYWNLIRDMLNKYANYNLNDDEVLLIKIDDKYVAMTDIFMRMLEPKELYLAQGFPEDYNYTCNGQMTRTQQVAKCGNSVSPSLSYALAKANVEIQNIPPLQTMASLYHYMSHGSLRKMKSKDGAFNE